MSDERNSGAAGVVVAFTLGALVGAVAALLFAPAKGEETRELLAEKAREGAAKEAFVKEHGVGGAHSRERFDGLKPAEPSLHGARHI